MSVKVEYVSSALLNWAVSEDLSWLSLSYVSYLQEEEVAGVLTIIKFYFSVLRFSREMNGFHIYYHCVTCLQDTSLL